MVYNLYVKEFKIFIFVLLIYIFCFIVVYTSGVNKVLIQSEDTVSSIVLPLAIIEGHTFYLDRFYPLMSKTYPQPDGEDEPYYLKKVDEHYLSFFPVVASILSLPVFTFIYLFNLPINFEVLGILGKLSAMIMVSLSAIFMYKILLFLDSGKTWALRLTFIYAFATNVFGHSAQSLWHNSATHLLLNIGIYLLLKFSKTLSKTDVFWAGFILSLSVINRPTNAVIVGLLSLFFIFKYKFKNIGFFVLAVLIPIVFYYLYNSHYFVSFENQGYITQFLRNMTARFPESLLGSLFSPSKGIFIYSPIFIFSIVGLVESIKKKNWFYITLGIILFVYILILSKWNHWYGGYSFGYRMFIDLITLFIMLLVPYVKSDSYNKTKVIFIVSIIWSFVIQLMGVAFFDGIWHNLYDKGTSSYAWLWSIKDSEIIFNIKRILFKAHVITDNTFLIKK